MNKFKTDGSKSNPKSGSERAREKQRVADLHRIGPRYQIEVRQNVVVPAKVTPLLMLDGGVNPELLRPKFRRTSILNLRNSVSAQCI